MTPGVGAGVSILRLRTGGLKRGTMDRHADDGIGAGSCHNLA